LAGTAKEGLGGEEESREMEGKGRSDLFFIKFEEGNYGNPKTCIPKLIRMK
jgi:hypothetical protein